MTSVSAEPDTFRGRARLSMAGTPTFFVNDRRYTGPYDVDSLGAALRSAKKDAWSRRPAQWAERAGE